LLTILHLFPANAFSWRYPIHRRREDMFDHVKFGVSDYAASKAFFLQALARLA
jgi:hypothetical protein